MWWRRRYATVELNGFKWRVRRYSKTTMKETVDAMNQYCRRCADRVMNTESSHGKVMAYIDLYTGKLAVIRKFNPRLARFLDGQEIDLLDTVIKYLFCQSGLALNFEPGMSVPLQLMPDQGDHHESTSSH